MKLITELEGRELDAAVATEVMGLCIHLWTETPTEILLAEARAEFKDDYDGPPPEKWEPEWGWDDWDLTCGGCGIRRSGGGNTLHPRNGQFAQYSTDTASAWRVVEKVRETRGVEVSIESNGDRWWVDITDGTSGTFDSSGSYDRVLGQAGGDTPGEAICRAALEVARRV